MFVDESDAHESVAELSDLALVLLGEQRAEQLHSALIKRGVQFARVEGALTIRGGRPKTHARPAKPTAANPTSASVAAERACRGRISALDGKLLAFAWSAEEPSGGPAESGASGAVLDGLAVGVKDVIDVAGMPTRSGSPLTSPDPVAADAPVVARLRQAGAAILGKTHCTEWALNDPASTLNPWDVTRTPGGSSAGSAVAVASGMCTATVDTQTAGDVLRPAAYNGMVGFKPTLGWASLDGVQPVASTIDTIGVIARRVGSAGAVASAIADADHDFLAERVPDPVRIGLLTDPFLDDTIRAVRDNVVGVADQLAGAGALVEKVCPPVDLSLVHAAHRVITFAECASYHLARYRKLGRQYGRRARELIDLGLLTPAHAYFAAQVVRREATAVLATCFADIDVLLLPVTPRPAPLRGTTGDSAYQIPWTLCGLPALALPSGVAAGLPLGVQLVAAPHHDSKLLAVAEWCEEILDVHLDPGC